MFLNNDLLAKLPDGVAFVGNGAALGTSLGHKSSKFEP